MARLRQGPSRAVAAVLMVLAVLLLSIPVHTASGQTPSTNLYDRPTLVVDPGMHTAPITGVAVDQAGQFAVTGSYDKTVRVWSVSNGELLQTIRMPAGPSNAGKIFAVAISPDANLIAAGGWTLGDNEHPIYLFDRSTGKMIERIAGLPNVTLKLVFSINGRYLAAGLGGEDGLRIYDRDKGWAEAFRDTDYHGKTYGAAFTADGRLATASYDGRVRLYDRDFTFVVPPKKAMSGNQPRALAFSPDGATLALGYSDSATMDLLDGHTLETLPSDNRLDRASVLQVAWSTDGQTLLAAGQCCEVDSKSVVVWAGAGRGERRTLPVSSATIRGLALSPDGGIILGTAGPDLTMLKPDGTAHWHHRVPTARFLNQKKIFAVSATGTKIDFGFESFGKTPLRFDLSTLSLSGNPSRDTLTVPPKQDGLPIEDWSNSYEPTLDGERVDLKELELSRSMAIHPDSTRFVLGTNWTLRAFDAKGEPLWKHAAPSEVWAVNITGDGRIVVAAYGDGTIRWHRMDDGRELLAFMVLADRKNWVAWTPEGFYAATSGAHGVLRWHVNRGPKATGEAIPVSEFAALYRPKMLSLVLQEMETARAIGLAVIAETREAIRLRTGASVAPGAQLHVLAIGVSAYGEKSGHLRLDFAHKDASDLANSLYSTQAGLYARVNPAYLHDKTADKAGIFEAFASMQRNMAKASPGQDVAVVMFSGHGAMIDNHFYLLPHGVDARTSAQIKASAIPASQFQAEVAKLAGYGRVLVLLDACRSGAVTADGSKFGTNADLLRSIIASGNVTVLTSSKADKLSLEDKDWQNGAFTKVLLEALGGAADDDKNGLISTTELTAYMARRLPLLSGDQHPGIELRFENDIFAAGL